MVRSLNFRPVFTSVALVAALAGTACVDIIGADMGGFVDREEKRFQISGTPDLDLSTFDGSIEIRPWDRPEVLVVIEKHGQDKSDTDNIQIVAHQDGRRISIEARLPDGKRDSGFWHANFASATLIASVPATSNVTAHSGDGSIKLEDIAGALDVDTGDGSITASGKFPSVRARSGDGSVRIQAAPGSAASEDWNITTGDGSITLELPDGFGGELDARTGDGSVRADDLSVSNVSGRMDKHALRGTLGAGGHTVRLRTGDGSITLRRF